MFDSFTFFANFVRVKEKLDFSKNYNARSKLVSAFETLKGPLQYYMTNLKIHLKMGPMVINIKAMYINVNVSPCYVIFLNCSVKNVCYVFPLPVLDVQACCVFLINTRSTINDVTKNNIWANQVLHF